VWVDCMVSLYQQCCVGRLYEKCFVCSVYHKCLAYIRCVLMVTYQKVLTDGVMKNFIDTIGNRTRDRPVCSAVPQPTVSMYCINTVHDIKEKI
jgi:hypothetical protein